MSPVPFYDDGQVTLYCADLRAVDLPRGSVASVVTSPPYNLGVDYDTAFDSLDWLAYGQLAADAAALMARALIDGGRAWINTAVSVPAEPEPPARAQGCKSRVMLARRWAATLADVGVVPVDQIAWCSMRGAGTAWGSWESPAAPNLRGDWESVIVAAKGARERPAPPGMEDWRDGVGGWAALCSTVRQLTPAPRDGHPAPFPVELARRCVRLSTWPGEVVLDPFAGSGTTLVAARQLGRRAIGIEPSQSVPMHDSGHTYPCSIGEASTGAALKCWPSDADLDQHRRMSFDFEDVFGDDYLHFYASQLTDERNDREADEIVSLLGLGDGDTVLDAPCGHGRISNRLAQRGLHVVGVDASTRFLEIAREAGTDADYRLGDLRHLPVSGPFDAAISWFTSFGYYEDDESRQTLAEYRRVLRPGGRLLLETQNHDEFVRRFTPAPFSHQMQVNDDLMIDTSEFDCLTGRVEADRIIVRDGQVRRMHFSVRFPTIPELRVWLADAGFAASEFRARDGGVPAIDRPRLVVLATA